MYVPGEIVLTATRSAKWVVTRCIMGDEYHRYEILPLETMLQLQAALLRGDSETTYRKHKRIAPPGAISPQLDLFPYDSALLHRLECSRFLMATEETALYIKHFGLRRYPQGTLVQMQDPVPPYNPKRISTVKVVDETACLVYASPLQLLLDFRPIQAGSWDTDLQDRQEEGWETSPVYQED